MTNASRPRPLQALLIAGTLLALATTQPGCSDSGSGNGGTPTPPSGQSLGGTAMDATLATLSASFRTGNPTIDASISQGSVANPLVATTPSNEAVTLGALANDGSVGSAQVEVTGTRDASTGTESVTLRVSNAATMDVFLTLTLNVTRVDVTYRLAPLGLSNLASDGTGQAFALVRYAYQGDLRREFQNDRNGVRLIDYGGFSPPAATFTQFATFSGFLEYVVAYRLSTNASGVLEARVTRLDPAASGLIFQRTGGPAASAVIQTLDAVTVDGLVAIEGSDTAAVIGPDKSAGANATPTAALVANLRFSGGVTGGLFTTDVTGPVTPPATASPGFAINYMGALTGLTNVGDGVVQADQFVRMTTSSRESPGAAALSHSLEGKLGTLSATLQRLTAELEQAIYLPTASSMEQALLLYR